MFRHVANEFDAVVVDESHPSLATFVFGTDAEQVAEQFLGPVTTRPKTAR